MQTFPDIPFAGWKDTLGGWCFSRGGDPVERTALE
jgi:hypothetical protein